jgi:hypothetical protein
MNSLSSTRSPFFTTSTSDRCDRLPLRYISKCQVLEAGTRTSDSKSEVSGKRGSARRDVHPLPLEVGQLPFDEVVVTRALLLLRIDRTHFLRRRVSILPQTLTGLDD